jgi:glycosyltransferase involved in cell wall biosynthesis
VGRRDDAAVSNDGSGAADKQITVASALRILHAIHDFLPRHHAGSEIYAFELGRAQAARHHVSILCADYDPSRRHGHVTWRVHGGVPVIEIANNWVCSSFADTYRAPAIAEQIAHVLAAVQPDVLHVHNLLNLSFDVPAIARARGIRVVATLHDYTLLCASGGQRIHRAEEHVCRSIDPDRCARCFRESPFFAQMSIARMGRATGTSALLHRIGAWINRRAPAVVQHLSRAARAAPAVPVSSDEITARLAGAREVFDHVDLFVAPSPSIASEFVRFGVDKKKIRVSDYGFMPLRRLRAKTRSTRLRIGYVGTLVWHKGVHVLLDAVRTLPSAAYELKIFGDPEVFPEYTARLRTTAAGLPVQFMGAFGRERTADVYEQLDVLVVPSLWLENSPLVIHEAFMAGVPVIGARMGGIADLIRHGENGLLYEATSATALAAAIRGLFDRPGRLAEFARRLPKVKSIEADAAEWESAYEEVLGHRMVAGAIG